MPQIFAFNRKWAIGSDDFVYPGIAEIILRIVWIIAISIVFHLHKDAFECDGGHLLRAYYIGLLALLCVSIVMTAGIVYTSMKGTMISNWQRRRLPKYLYIKFAISLPELAWNIMGTYWAFGKSSGCESHVVLTVKGAVISGWAIAVIVIVGIAVIFDPLGAAKQDGQSNTADGDSAVYEVSDAAKAAQKVWERRCRLLCCCVGCDENSTDAFSGIAQLFTNFFQNVDLVPTDIASGFILVQREQERRNYQLHSVRIESLPRQTSSSSYSTFTPTPQSAAEISVTATVSPDLQVTTNTSDVRTQRITPKPWMTTSQMHHYMKFAMAVYGWPLFIFSHLTTGACQLWSQCKCCSCMMSSKSYITNDNCCQCNTAAIRKTTGLHPDDIVYASFHNKIYEIPFLVCIDRERSAVVISIRGTLSFKDVITDLTADVEELEIEGLESCVTHKGILQAAKYVKQTLERLHILEQAFDRAQGAKLVITGHSLGAGAASLLSILLRPQYPELQCFAFSPPGELISLCASVYTQEFICSVVLGKDLVPRLGMHRMEELKTKLLRAIQHCDIPKFKLLASGAWQVLCGLPEPTEDDLHDTRSDRPLVQDGQGNGHINHAEAALEEAISVSERRRLTSAPLFLPGQIMHILEVETNKSCCSGIPDYYAEWSQAENFCEILVSPKMLSDHMPDAVMRALDQLANNNFTPRALKLYSEPTTV